MKVISDMLIKLGIPKNDLDYHCIRASVVIIYLCYGCQKWFEYDSQALVSYVSHEPLICGRTPFSVCAAQAIFCELLNGYSVFCCLLGFGTKNWVSLARSVRFFRL
jgi:hypothetical protein